MGGAGDAWGLVCREGSVVQWAARQTSSYVDVHGRQVVVCRRLVTPGAEGAVPGLCGVGKIGLGELLEPVSLSQAAYLLPLAWAGAGCPLSPGVMFLGLMLAL